MAEADEESSSQQRKKPPWYYLDTPSAQGPMEELNNFIQVLRRERNKAVSLECTDVINIYNTHRE